jgi:O-antigen ligase
MHEKARSGGLFHFNSSRYLASWIMSLRQESDVPRSGAELDVAPAPSRSTSAQPQRIGLLLAGGLCMLPFLLPYNQLFQAEWLAGALGVVAALATLAGRDNTRPKLSLPAPARWLTAFAVFLCAQDFVVHPIYPQVPALAVIYVLYAVLLIWFGAQLAATNGIERAATLLAACLLAGAVLNAAAGAIQFYGRPGVLEEVVAELPYRAGAYGNIAQPNLYANYLALGASSLLLLWLRGKLRTTYALALCVPLVWSCALSGSRATLLYAGWFALLGLLAGRMHAGPDRRRLRSAAYVLALAIIVAHVAVPAINDMLGIGNASESALDRLLPTVSPRSYTPRWEIWQVAWRVFVSAPVTGAGIGEFAGAAFRSGLAPGSTQYGNQVWTSPHNLPLQLLAETGIVGTFLVLASLGSWCWQIGRQYALSSQPVFWWIIAAVGIEFIHSMVEFPLWSAHFLGVTAVLIGLGTSARAGTRAAARASSIAAAAICAILALALALLLRDYVRLSTTRVTGAAITLASETVTARDTTILRTLTRGLLAPPAEYAIILGASLDRSELADRLNMSERIARHYPAHAIVVRHAVFLAFDGKAKQAREVLAQAIHTFPKRCKETERILAQARTADPGAIEPLLDLARETSRSDCM